MLWSLFTLHFAHGKTENCPGDANNRECSDRYCINCICVVLISLHFINLIKISSAELLRRALHMQSESFSASAVSVDVNYYFNNKPQPEQCRNANCAVNRFMFIFNRSVSRFKMLSWMLHWADLQKTTLELVWVDGWNAIVWKKGRWHEAREGEAKSYLFIPCARCIATVSTF